MGSPSCEFRQKQLWPHCWGHDAKEADGGQIQERLCKIPFRQPERQFGNGRGESKRVELMLEVAASFLTSEESTSKAKLQISVTEITGSAKW
jgi:hypothetical protein